MVDSQSKAQGNGKELSAIVGETRGLLRRKGHETWRKKTPQASVPPIYSVSSFPIVGFPYALIPYASCALRIPSSNARRKYIACRPPVAYPTSLPKPPVSWFPGLWKLNRFPYRSPGECTVISRPSLLAVSRILCVVYRSMGNYSKNASMGSRSVMGSVSQIPLLRS